MAPKRSSTTISTYRQLSTKSRYDLAIALGYAVKLGEACETPHIKDILSHWPGKGTLDEYVQLFIKIVEYFTRGKDCQSLTRRHIKPITVKHCIDELVNDATQDYFRDVPPGTETRRDVITDTVLLVLGSWVLMRSYFTLQRGEPRRILLAYCWNNNKEYSESLSLEETLPDLLHKSGLLPNPNEMTALMQGKKSEVVDRDKENDSSMSIPNIALHPSLGSVESLEISAKTLNAFKLAHLGAVRILWTNNLSRHLLLSNHAKKFYLELFAIPSALQAGPDTVLTHAGITGDLMDEVRQSYANLFNPKRTGYWHTYLGTPLGINLWCWCLSCSSKRLRNRELKKLKSTSSVPATLKLIDATRPRYDPDLKHLMSRRAEGWDQREFENFWPRIVALDAHLSGSRPWSFWVIFRDRRDSVQFWTFL
ncbi:hypothetical protein BKA66DRAFT_443302 [Pyrenochaeta sp. MPI-SDFR-AT-0127]|nr:hypothetical protein BKA66DRAFT_443302 [Pyrenochaeta sp. MPI-SDFR-AT-0127]